MNSISYGGYARQVAAARQRRRQTIAALAVLDFVCWLPATLFAFGVL
jgi:hypothetical protein